MKKKLRINNIMSEVVWQCYQDNVYLWNILPKRNVELAYIQYDEFLEELEKR